jgi:hypothetical protein
MSFAAIRSGEPIPIFDGTDYPYWKDKMMRNIISIDLNAWNIVENGVMVLDKDNLTEAEKKDLMIDNQVWLFITNHLVPNKYHEVKNIASAKGVWEYLEKIGEGKSTQKEARVDILRSKFHRFKRHEGEKVNSIYNRLVALANELESLGAKDVDPHMVVRMLLRSLDESFSHVILMIRKGLTTERWCLLMFSRDLPPLRKKKMRSVKSMEPEGELMPSRQKLRSILPRKADLSLVLILIVPQILGRT